MFLQLSSICTLYTYAHTDMSTARLLSSRRLPKRVPEELANVSNHWSAHVNMDVNESLLTVSLISNLIAMFSQFIQTHAVHVQAPT